MNDITTTVRTLYRRFRYGTTDPDEIACIREEGLQQVAGHCVEKHRVDAGNPNESFAWYECVDCGREAYGISQFYWHLCFGGGA